MPKLLNKAIATRGQKAQLRIAKVLAALMLTGESEAHIKADIRAAADYATKTAEVLENDGNYKGHRFSGARSNTVADNAQAFCHTVMVGNIPTSGKAKTPAAEQPAEQPAVEQPALA